MTALNAKIPKNCVYIYKVQFSHHLRTELAFGFVTKNNDNLNFRAEEIDKTSVFMTEGWLNTGYCKRKN